MSHGECMHLVSYYKTCEECEKEKAADHAERVRLYNRTLEEKIAEAPDEILVDGVAYVKAATVEKKLDDLLIKMKGLKG